MFGYIKAVFFLVLGVIIFITLIMKLNALKFIMLMYTFYTDIVSKIVL